MTLAVSPQHLLARLKGEPFSEIGADVVTPRRRSSTFVLMLAIVGSLACLRLLGLYFSQVDLFYDEAQYWAWSRELAFGYFSKPPLLAWILAVSNNVCGTTEACVRSSVPLFYFGLSLLTYSIASLLYDRRVALWSALFISLLPGVIFSSRIVSTDVPLVFFWAVALLAYLKLMQSDRWRWALLLGGSLGLGLLAKYAMIYFFAGIAVSALVDSRARALLLSSRFWCACAIAFMMILPNLVWNGENGFITLKQTGDNIQGDGFSFSLRTAGEFLLTQFGVFGPLIFGSFIGVLATCRSPDINRSDRLMIAFALPPLFLVCLLALFKPVNANWAAAAGVSMAIVTAAVLLRRNHRAFPLGILAIGAVVQIGLQIGDTMPYQLSVPVSGQPVDVYHRTLGWRALGEQTGALARQFEAKTIVSEGRYEMASLIYYLRDLPKPIRSWPRSSSIPDSQFDLSDAIESEVALPVLFVTPCPTQGRLSDYFDSVRSLGTIQTSTGPHSGRQYYAFMLDRPSRPIGSIRACGY